MLQTLAKRIHLLQRLTIAILHVKTTITEYELYHTQWEKMSYLCRRKWSISTTKQTRIAFVHNVNRNTHLYWKVILKMNISSTTSHAKMLGKWMEVSKNTIGGKGRLNEANKTLTSQKWWCPLQYYSYHNYHLHSYHKHSANTSVQSSSGESHPGKTTFFLSVSHASLA